MKGNAVKKDHETKGKVVEPTGNKCIAFARSEIKCFKLKFKHVYILQRRLFLGETPLSVALCDSQ